MSPRGRRPRGDGGQLLAETPVVFALVLLVLLLCLQGVLWATTALLARHAAFEGARTAATSPVDVADAARAVLPAGWSASGVTDVGGAVTVDVVGPVLVPGLTGALTITASAPVVAEPR